MSQTLDVVTDWNEVGKEDVTLVLYPKDNLHLCFHPVVQANTSAET